MYIVAFMTTGKYGPSLGTVLECSDQDDAIEKCIQLALENNPPESEAEVRAEVKESLGYGHPDGDWSCHIGITQTIN